MLLRLEVAAFHPAMPTPVAGRRNTEMAVSVRAKRARAAVSSLWSYSSAVPEDTTGRPLAVTLPCGVRTFLDELAPTAPPAFYSWLRIHVPSSTFSRTSSSRCRAARFRG